MDFIGCGDFTLTGNEFLGYLKKYRALEPGECVLDVGCGVGSDGHATHKIFIEIGKLRRV